MLYYGEFVNHFPKNPYSEERDRVIISKAHGSISLYPIFSDLGYFDKRYLQLVGKPGGILGDIPDCSIPGYETLNGALGHGLGVASGIALALRKKKKRNNVVALLGDGELHEGAVWEAVMFAAHNNLSNLFVILDNNEKCMLGRTEDVLTLNPVSQKFEAFGWNVSQINGHDIDELITAYSCFGSEGNGRPTIIIANTVKGRGVKRLEDDPICHVRALSTEELDDYLGRLE